MRQEVTAFPWAKGLLTDQVFHVRRTIPRMAIAAAPSSAGCLSAPCSSNPYSSALRNQRPLGHVSRAQPSMLNMGPCPCTWHMHTHRVRVHAYVYGMHGRGACVLTHTFNLCFVADAPQHVRTMARSERKVNATQQRKAELDRQRKISEEASERKRLNRVKKIARKLRHSKTKDNHTHVKVSMGRRRKPRTAKSHKYHRRPQGMRSAAREAMDGRPSPEHCEYLSSRLNDRIRQLVHKRTSSAVATAVGIGRMLDGLLSPWLICMSLMSRTFGLPIGETDAPSPLPSLPLPIAKPSPRLIKPSSHAPGGPSLAMPCVSSTIAMVLSLVALLSMIYLLIHGPHIFHPAAVQSSRQHASNVSMQLFLDPVITTTQTPKEQIGSSQWQGCGEASPPPVPPQLQSSQPHPASFTFVSALFLDGPCVDECCVSRHCIQPSPPPSPAPNEDSSASDGDYSSSGEGKSLMAEQRAKRQQRREDRSPSWQTPQLAPPPPDCTVSGTVLTESIGEQSTAVPLNACSLADEPSTQPSPEATELTEGELLDLAAMDEAMPLTEREQKELVKVRQGCAQLGHCERLSLKVSAQRHAFKLVTLESKRYALCLRCEGRAGYAPTATGKDHRFLGNFWNRHLADSDSGHHKATGAGTAAMPSSLNAAAQASSEIRANFAAAEAARLTEEQLFALASLDDPELSKEQQVCAAELRQEIHAHYEGGAMLHIFRVTFEAGAWMVECVCCGTQQSAQSGEHFLANFASRHLINPRHHHAAERRYAAIRTACRDALRFMAAQAEAAAGRASLSGDAQCATRLAEEAREAAQRAEVIADRLIAMEAAGIPPLPPPLRPGEVLSQPMVPTELEALVGSNPALAWLKDAEGERCGVCCNFCRGKKIEGTNDADVLRKVQEHITKSKEHLERSAHGGRTLLSFFGAQSPGPAPAPTAPPDLSTVCHGYYKPSIVLSKANGTSFAADVRFLLERMPDARALWRPDAYFTGTLAIGGSSSAPQEVAVEGTLRSVRCRRLNVGADGSRGLHGMCDACRALPCEHTFKELVRKHHLALERPRMASKTRFDLMSHTRRLEVMRSLAARVRLLKHQLFTLGLKYQYKCRRVRSLKVSLCLRSKGQPISACLGFGLMESHVAGRSGSRS